MKKQLVTFAALISVFAATHLFAFEPIYRYMIIVDAGSTSSKLHVFQYDTNSSLPNIKDIFSESVKPGLSSFASNPDASGASLKPVLDDAAAFVQTNGINARSVKINVLATAGMRLLSKDQQDAIDANVSNYLKTNYQFPLGDVKTISGKMEGVYGWLDINYLAEVFKYNQASQPTAGSIDMGGASTQIAFATSVSSQNKHRLTSNEVALKINGINYTVFSKSFLGLGQDQARATMNNDSQAASCYPANYVYAQNASGNFNFYYCQNIYDDVIAAKRVAQDIPSTKNQKFIAYSGVYYAYNFFQVDTNPAQSVVEAKIQQVCNTGWDQMKKDYPAVPEKYLSADCANATYDADLLYNTYQLTGDQMTVLSKINGTDIDWPLGAVLYQLTNS